MSEPFGSLLGWAARKGYWLGSNKRIRQLRQNRGWHARPGTDPTIEFLSGILPGRSKKKRPGKPRKYRVIVRYGRYRETVPAHRLNFYGDVSGKKLLAGDTIGVKKYYTNGIVTSSENLHTTGTPPDSETRKMTWDNLNPGPPYLSGGPFASVNYEIPNATVQAVGHYSDIGKPGVLPQNRTEYIGGFADDGTWGGDSLSDYHVSTPPIVPVGYDSLAWDTLKPRVAKVNVAQFLYELKDLPHMLVTTANLLHNSWRSFGGGYSTIVMHPSSVADNFLNHQFGWLPFLNDLNGLFDTFSRINDHVSTVVRDNGRWVRKKRVLEEVTSQTLVYSSDIAAAMPIGNALDPLCQGIWDGSRWRYGKTQIYREEVTRVWASGNFLYYRPEFDDRDPNFSGQFMNVRRLLTLYGARINPTLLWKITPWTWAVDWFTRFGDYIQHHDDFITDGIVSKNLYIMRSYVRRVTKSVTRYFYSGPCTMQWQREYATKARKVADSPYGFDRPWNSLSMRQLAILGAIGISRTNTGFIARG